MDSSSLRSESHIAQQSRRDKLRIQPSSTSVHHLIDDFNNGLENFSVYSRLNPNIVQVRNVRNANFLYEPSTNIFSSDHMLNFANSTNVLPSQRNSMVDGQELGAVQVQPNRLMGIDSSSSSFANMSKVSSSDPQGCNNWRSIDSYQDYDLMVNYAGGSSSVLGRESNHKPMFVGAVLSNNARVSNVSTSVQYSKPNYNGYQDVQSSLPNPSNELPGQDHGQKQFRNQMQFNSHHIHSIYQNSLHDVVTPVPHGNESSSLYTDSVNSWMNRSVENSHQWSSELGLITRKNDQEFDTNIASDPNTQALSLSLSSNPPSRRNITLLGEGYQSEFLQSGSSVFKEPGQDSKPFKPNYLCPIMSMKPSIISRSSTGKSINEMMGTCNYALRNAGPLGPFTGYATILKSCRFLKTAQELLDEFCTATGSKHIQTCEGPARICSEVTCLTSVDAANAADPEPRAKGNHNNSVISSSAFYSTNDITRNVGFTSTSGESYRPEYQQKKAQLLYMQEEVCRKYKQYHQQMQMVASSFESVAGLSAATPYVSLALKTVSRNFRSLKHAISYQLKHVTRALGEDLLSPDAGSSSCKGDTSTSRMRYMDQSLQRLKSEAHVGFFKPQQHIWRPQRGLPERSVQILRAWLFEHFLHPYPSDNDKQMLATQTGLTRNQVSNWFINARVRVWKPMVEEIHMLETKAMAETNRSSVDDDGKSAEGTSQPNHEQLLNNLGSSSMINKQLECSGSTSGSGEQMGTEQWSQEKRSRLEFQVPTSMDGSVMNFLPYQRNGIDIGGRGAVSLTLGLRHSVENVHQQQHEDQVRRQFAGQMIHDFVG